MTDLRHIVEWLELCPALRGEPLVPDYLPSRKGWSVTLDGQSVRRDILGGRSVRLRLKITRRVSVADRDARLAVLEQLGELAAWAEANPPAGGSVRPTGLPEYAGRSTSGTEDFTVTVTVVTDE